MTKVKVYKVSDTATLPTYGTERASCFDIYADLRPRSIVKGYSIYNKEINFVVDEQGSITLRAGDRVMIPTGMIFDIPEGYSIRLHPRSGISLKQGLDLSNSEAVIDEDFVDPSFVLLRNNSMSSVNITHKMRVAQGELRKDERAEFEVTTEVIVLKSDRNGGFGSTGH